jgi:hypothetical protein
MSRDLFVKCLEGITGKKPNPDARYELKLDSFWRTKQVEIYDREQQCIMFSGTPWEVLVVIESNQAQREPWKDFNIVQSGKIS